VNQSLATTDATAVRLEMFGRAMAAAAAVSGNGQRPLLYGSDGRPAPLSAAYGVQRTAAAHAQGLENWIPRRLATRQREAREREAITERATDLVYNDPHVTGLQETFATIAVGPGLFHIPPLPLLNSSMLCAGIAYGMPITSSGRQGKPC